MAIRLSEGDSDRVKKRERLFWMERKNGLKVSSVSDGDAAAAGNVTGCFDK